MMLNALLAAGALLTAGMAAAELPRDLAKIDKNKDGKISSAEWLDGRKATFKGYDLNKDGSVSRDELVAHFEKIAPKSDKNETRISKVMAWDKNGDGKISSEEMVAASESAFAKRDKNADGFITAEEA